MNNTIAVISTQNETNLLTVKGALRHMTDSEGDTLEVSNPFGHPHTFVVDLTDQRNAGALKAQIQEQLNRNKMLRGSRIVIQDY